MARLKVTTVGNSLGVVLPRELLAKLRVEKGDTLLALETPDGVLLTPYGVERERQLEVAEGVMREDRDVLRRLAGDAVDAPDWPLSGGTRPTRSGMGELASEPVWIEEGTARGIHQRLLAEHGGLDGVRAPGGLQSALARPRHLHAYGDPVPDLAAMATAYAGGFVRDHAFVDGNKRVALVAARTFLRLNGCDLRAATDEKYRAVMALAAGKLPEEQFAAWVRAHLAPWQSRR